MSRLEEAIVKVLLRCGPLTGLQLIASAPATELSDFWLLRYRIYPTLRSMERRGILACEERPGGAERGGRPRFWYSVRGSQ